MKINYNECKYDAGCKNPHHFCTHQGYCIFNETRWELEKELTSIRKKYNEVKETLTFIQTEGTNNTKYTYEDCLTRLSLLREDSRTLHEYKNKLLSSGECTI